LNKKTCNQTFVCHPKKQTRNIKCHALVKYSVPAILCASFYTDCLSEQPFLAVL
jgi:hypothetical protein